MKQKPEHILYEQKTGDIIYESYINSINQFGAGIDRKIDKR